MAVGSGELTALTPVNGVEISCAQAGIKKAGRDDVVLFTLCEGAQTAATFTTNAFCAAPVQLAKTHLAARQPRYLLINTGNANAGTGALGKSNALRSCQSLANLADVPVETVLPFSTGVIGEHLPVEKIEAVIPAMLAESNADWLQAARGIMTTDTRPKGFSEKIELEGEEVVITGISKGAGMIKPNMATMLAFVASDAACTASCLQEIIRHAVEKSFNRITVDGDTSTNDACVLVATGKSSGQVIEKATDPRYVAFRDAVTRVFIQLAQMIVRDAEGATKFVTVTVEGGRDNEECLKAAYAVAESPLVKTALFASDPNWGRILAAVGRAGVEQLDVGGVSVFLDEALIAENGARAAAYSEQAAQLIMNRSEFTIRINLGRGSCSETVWTSDLSHDYVKINAEYRS